MRDKTTPDAPARRPPRSLLTRRRSKHRATSRRDVFVMPDFMRKHRVPVPARQVGLRVCRKGQFSKTSEPGEEGVGVTRPFTAVHYFDAAGWKFSALRQCKEAFAQRALRQRRELVEERHDHHRGDQQQKQLEHDHDRGCPNPPGLGQSTRSASTPARAMETRTTPPAKILSDDQAPTSCR
mgnify:CR=1 FL=1